MLSVMIIDDEERICEVMGEYLEKKGCKVRTSQTGEEAVEMIKKDKPDFVLLDLYMPGMGGESTLEEIRKISPDLPIIIITVDPHSETAMRLLKKGAIDYFVKPFDFYLLEKIVSTWDNTAH